MNQWGDEFERRHFDGNFVQSVVGAPTAAFQAMTDWGDDFERRHFEGDFLGSVAGAPVMAGEVISEAVGQLVDTVDSSSSTAYPPMAPMEPFGFNGEMQNSLPAYCAAENSERLEEREVSPKSQPSVQVTDSSGGPGPGLPSGPGVLATGRTADEVATFMASLPDGGLEEVARDLQLQLEEEYGKRHGRVEALRALKAHLLKLPGEIAEEQRLVDLAAGTRAAQGARVTAAGRALQTLKEHHHHLQDHQAALLEEREQLDAAKAAAAAAVERQTQLTHASCVREWARDGPETEALKEAKVELAQLLAEVDEARLHRRQELKALYQAVEATEAENKWHRAGGHDAYTAPGGSFGASLRRLFAVARGRRDPYPTSP
eukprot:Skav221554  [mRNA]  locus=scaffold1376:112856:113977:- [translate_table: standard]